MKAVRVEQPGAQPYVVNDVPVPKPGEGQILVKSVFTAINPVDAIMAQTGAMVPSFPFSPGCDAGGVVIKSGPKAINAMGREWGAGDRVFGCTRLGTPGHSAWGEYFLMEARVAVPVPPNLSLEQAGGMGVGLLTAAEGVFSCLGLPLPTDTASSATHAGNDKSWALVLGGASSVGFHAVQLLLACGLRVVSTCAQRSSALLEELGVRHVSYARPEQEIIDEVARITDSRVRYVFDAVGSNNGLMPRLVAAVCGEKEVRITTTNAFEPLPLIEGTIANTIQLGSIGQPGPEATELNDAITKYISVLYALMKSGKVKAGPYQIAGEGIEGILTAWEVQKSGKVAGKVVVKIADE